jgi:Phosphotransferase system, mannose/fructose/N-acetylgalactosamine-specific component IIB
MQKVANIRIDVRLIHGQVAGMWVNTLHITRIMVVDELALKDDILKMALKMACPSGVKLSLLGPDKAAANLLEEKYTDDNIMLVVRDPAMLVKLWDNGYKMETVNVGNMANAHDTKMVKKTVHVNPKNVADFLELDKKGVKFTAQMYPNEDAFDIMGVIKKL